jgi:hypothetical protein
MTDESTPELSTEEAIVAANREAFVVAPPLSAAVNQYDGDAMVTMRVTRMIGGVAREFSMAIGRNRTAQEFADMARKNWLALVQEAEAWKATQPKVFGSKVGT